MGIALYSLSFDACLAVQGPPFEVILIATLNLKSFNS